MDDLISRAAAIDAVKKNTFRMTFAQERNGKGYVQWSAEAVYSDVMEEELLNLPSAQPDLESAYAEGYTAAEAEFHKLMDAQESDVARDIATIIENERDMRVILKNAEHTETHESRREWYMKGYRDAQNAALHESCTDCPLYDHDRHSCPRFNHVIPTAIRDAQRWIPVTEALPEDDKRVLCQMKDGELVFGFHQGKYWAYGQKPIAWMPLPPSYKGDEDE